MRIGILTHPQHLNYGGILQCYALSTYLKNLGHDVIVIKRELDITPIKRFVLNILKALHVPGYYDGNEIDCGLNIRPFSERYLNRTTPVRSQRAMKRICKKYHLDTVIVGSDQVWRADFALKYGFNYFLDFVPTEVGKFSYAASFGLKEWLYSTDQTKRIKELLAGYSGVSVREEEAVLLCSKFLNITAEHNVDPTLLLTSDDYDKIAVFTPAIKDPYVFIYWLGEESIIQEELSKIKNAGKELVYIGLRNNVVLPSVEEWISYIKHADSVITDSFHGAVFSLLYHKPLKVKQNVSGGYGRIQSLANLFGLEISQLNQLDEDGYLSIDLQLNNYREKSKEYINKSLQ